MANSGDVFSKLQLTTHPVKIPIEFVNRISFIFTLDLAVKGLAGICLLFETG